MKPACKLVGENGNIFNLIRIVSRTLRDKDMYEQEEEMMQRFMDGEPQSYEQALTILGEYVEIE